MSSPKPTSLPLPKPVSKKDASASDKIRRKELIERMSTLGEILKMLPGAPVDDALLASTFADMQPGEKIGGCLVVKRVITIEQLDRALSIQKKIREMGPENLDEIMSFFEEVRTEKDRALAELAAAQSAIFDAIPTSNPGIPDAELDAIPTSNPGVHDADAFDETVVRSPALGGRR